VDCVACADCAEGKAARVTPAPARIAKAKIEKANFFIFPAPLSAAAHISVGSLDTEQV
jgi:hypothetical protein